MSNAAFRDGEAAWIWSSEGGHQRRETGARHYEARRFRRTFRVETLDGAAVAAHVSADSRYVFYCNGVLVGRGPAKGDIRHHFYETYDLTPHLRAGENVLAAVVLDYSGILSHPPELGAPSSVMTYHGGFLLDGFLRQPGTEALRLSTGPEWRVTIDEAHTFQNEQNDYGGFMGYFERYRAAAAPTGWSLPGFDDGAWEPATVIYRAVHALDRRDCLAPYGLTPSMIPPLPEGPETRFQSAFLPGGGTPDPDVVRWLEGAAPLEIAPNSELRLILDVGQLTTAYPAVETAGGEGGEVRLTYAEALRLPHGTPDAVILGDRGSLAAVAIGFADEETGWTFDRRGRISGFCDVFEPAGPRAAYEPLTWRTFRYVELAVRTKDKPLSINNLRYRETRYPYEPLAEFRCSDPRLERCWKVSLRTFHLCAHETFEDCPYYEQMQYAGDTMITSHLGMLTSGDSRLSRQAIHQFAWSLLPEGITQSRYPSRLEQVIPSWSLHWITMMRDYLLYTGDRATVDELFHAVRQVLAWFQRRTGATGLPERLPYWNVTDWCPVWDRGQPPGWETEPTCVISAQYLLALRETAWMEGVLGREEEEARLLGEAEKLTQVFNRQFWSEEDGLYRDRAGGAELSQYGNAWAVCAGAADARRRARMAERFPSDPKLAPASFFGMHFVIRALRQLGLSHLANGLLEPWHHMAEAGLTTFAEETRFWRSLCHAWSAHPAVEFLTGVLGVKPAAPGFAAARVAPNPAGLDWASGKVPTPNGPLSVRWERTEGGIQAKVDAPKDMPVELVAPDGTSFEFPGGHFEALLPDRLETGQEAASAP